MKWAWVTTQTKQIEVEQWNDEERIDEFGTPYTIKVRSRVLLQKPAGTVCCLIKYDGNGDLTPPDFGIALKQVNDSAQIGDEGY